MEVVEFSFALFDVFKHLLSVVGVEWRVTSQHLINYTAKAPPVALFSICSFLLQNFRGEVFGRAAQTFCAGLVSHILLRQTEVS